MSNIVLASIPNPKLGDLQILKLFQGLAFLPSLQKAQLKCEIWM
jgi:hypothetical protein